MYLGIYLKKNNKTNKQKKTKQTKTEKEKKEKKKEERKELAGLEPSTFNSLQLYLTTALRLMTSLWREVFYLMPFRRKIHRQTPLKMIEPRKMVLLTVKKNKKKQQQQKQNAFYGNMNERTYVVCFTKPIHLVCEVRCKTYVFLSRFPLLL